MNRAHNINPNNNRTVSRTWLLKDTVKRWTDVMNRYFKTDFWAPHRIDLLINNELLAAIHVVLHDADETPLDGLYLNIDWGEYGIAKATLGEDVELPDGDEGKTFPDIDSAIRHVESFLKEAYEHPDTDGITMWFSFAEEKIADFGGKSKLFQIIDWEDTSTEKTKRLWRKIHDTQRRAEHRAFSPNSQQEVTIGAWYGRRDAS